MPHYAVIPYSASELGALLNKHSHKGEGAPHDRAHAAYFDEYLRHLSTKTILVESPYTDKDYLEDYATYYARCHDGYDKRCTRLHFFDCDFDQTLLDNCLAHDATAIEKFKTGYLGFVVIKPLPATIIGRTCLKTYGNIGGERYFPTTHEYKTHFLGLEFSVASVPFQEQDTDVAACATSAIWSALHSTGRLFHHHIPTPAKITESAGVHQRPEGRILPALSGLNAHQMADAIQSVGLEPLMLKTEDAAHNFLRIAAYAYMRAHIPSILLGSIGSGDTVTNFAEDGGHAIAVAGYSKPAGQVKPYGPSDTLFRATSIERLYAHDDQVGPFARLKFEAGKLIGTSWPDNNNARGNKFLKADMIIAPLYHKIRIPVHAVISVVSALDSWLEMARAAQLLPLSEKIIWDVYLHEVKDFKADIFKDTQLGTSLRKEVLTANLPRYIWRAEACCGDTKQFELLFDATDLLQGAFFLDGLPYNAVTCKAVGLFMKNPAIQGYMRLRGVHAVLGSRGVMKAAEWFVKYA